MHGGAPGSGAQKGNKNARKHGRYSAQAIAERERTRQIRSRVGMLMKLISELSED